MISSSPEMSSTAQLAQGRMNMSNEPEPNLMLTNVVRLTLKLIDKQYIIVYIGLCSIYWIVYNCFQSDI